MQKDQNGFTLIDVLVGIALLLIVFMGLFGAFQLGLKVSGLVKNKVIAIAIVNQKLEQIRNLPYESVGNTGGFPDGVLEASTTTVRNNIEYTVETRVDYVVDLADGIASPDDDCPQDYKKAEIKVSWSGLFGGEIKASTDISPKNLSEECATGGGILSVTVFDAFGGLVISPLIEVKDPLTDQTLKSAMPLEGKHYFSLATSTYKVVISKSGYSTERTYGTSEIATPEKPNPLILEDQLTEISLSIDKVSSFSVDTLSPWGTADFSDSFLDETKISEKANVLVDSGKVELVTSGEEYLASGYLVSIETTPADLVSWSEFSFSDSEPVDTDLDYQFYYASGTDWYLIPDADLIGNSSGFDLSPVDLSGLSIATYSKLKIKGNFSTNSISSTPVLYDWQLTWIISVATPIPNVPLWLQGAKIIGTDTAEQPVYKYSTSSTSNVSGQINIQNLEWDFYTFYASGTSLDLINTDPAPQPINLAPDVSLPVKLYFQAQNSLLLTIQNIDTLEPVFSATARLYNAGLGYDETQYTNEKGQTIFIPLSAASYNLEVEGPGYLATSTTVSILGDALRIVRLQRVE